MSIFRGAIPYAVDVNRIKEQYPVSSLTEGTVIQHGELEPLVNAKAGTQRYYGVVKSWIAATRNEHGIFMTIEPSVGVKVLDPAEVLHFAETRTRQKIGQTGRAIRNFAWVDRKRLDPVGQKRLDHQVRVAGAIKDALSAARKEMAIDLSPIKSLPKPSRDDGKPEGHHAV